MDSVQSIYNFMNGSFQIKQLEALLDRFNRLYSSSPALCKGVAALLEIDERYRCDFKTLRESLPSWTEFVAGSVPPQGRDGQATRIIRGRQVQAEPESSGVKIRTQLTKESFGSGSLPTEPEADKTMSVLRDQRMYESVVSVKHFEPINQSIKMSLPVKAERLSNSIRTPQKMMRPVTNDQRSGGRPANNSNIQVSASPNWEYELYPNKDVRQESNQWQRRLLEGTASPMPDYTRMKSEVSKQITHFSPKPNEFQSKLARQGLNVRNDGQWPQVNAPSPLPKMSLPDVPCHQMYMQSKPDSFHPEPPHQRSPDFSQTGNVHYFQPHLSYPSQNGFDPSLQYSQGQSFFDSVPFQPYPGHSASQQEFFNFNPSQLVLSTSQEVFAYPDLRQVHQQQYPDQIQQIDLSNQDFRRVENRTEMPENKPAFTSQAHPAHSPGLEHQNPSPVAQEPQQNVPTSKISQSLEKELESQIPPFGRMPDGTIMKAVYEEQLELDASGKQTLKIRVRYVPIEAADEVRANSYLHNSIMMNSQASDIVKDDPFKQDKQLQPSVSKENLPSQQQLSAQQSKDAVKGLRSPDMSSKGQTLTQFLKSMRQESAERTPFQLITSPSNFSK